MQRTKIKLLTIAALAMVAAIMIVAIILRASSGRASMHSVSIYLPGSPSQVTGMKVLVSHGTGEGDLLEPQRLTIFTVDGASLSIVARSSSVTVSGGKVEGVYVRRPLVPVRFLEAKADLLHTLSQLGIEPDTEMREEMALWTQDAPGNGDIPGVMPYDWKTGLRTPFHGLGVDVRISPDPNHGWYYLLIFSALTADVIPSFSPATQPTTVPAEGAPDVPIAIKLMGTASDIVGAHVQIRASGMDEADLLQPQKLTLTVPDGHTISLVARSSNIMFFDGIAHGVFIRGRMKPVSFDQAKAEMLKTLADLNIQPDRVMKMMMSDWDRYVSPAGQHSLSNSYQAGLEKPVHGAILTVRICPDGARGWYYLLIFSVGSTPAPP